MREIDKIKEKHSAGELEDIRLQLENFLSQNRDAFWQFREREMKLWQKDINPFVCLKLFILEKKTINFRSEMLSQIEEMRHEVASRGHGLSPEQVNGIKEEWARKHAASWRAHRILEIIYVLNENRELFLRVLCEGKDQTCP
jgi:hypothetical protein